MAWFGDSKGHAEAGRKGGKAQGKRNNPGNFANDREKAKRAGRKGGSSRGIQGLPETNPNDNQPEKQLVTVRHGFGNQQFEQ